MASIWSPFVVSPLGPSSLGFFSCNSLCFEVFKYKHLLRCREVSSHLQVPLILCSKELGNFAHCVGRFVPRKGLQVRGRLLGGGCCNSSLSAASGKDSALDLGSQTLRKRAAGHSQERAQQLAETVRDLCYKGISTGLPIRELSDFPQNAIATPLTLSECLMEAVDEEGFWKERFDFLVRHEIVRIARRQVVDFIIGSRSEFSGKPKSKMMKALRKLAQFAAEKDERWPESGVLAEIATLKMFISSAHDASRLLPKLTQAAPVLGLSYTSSTHTPVPALPQVLEALQTITAFRHSMELQLLIDDLYFQAEAGRMQELLPIVEFLLGKGQSKSWKTFYLALAFVEWTLHRGMWPDALVPKLLSLLSPFLTVSSCAAMGLRKKSWRLCEKLATILSKAYSNPLFRPLYRDMVARESDPRIQAMLTLAPESIYADPPAGIKCNLTATDGPRWREREVLDGVTKVRAQRQLAITGPGKSTLARDIAERMKLECGVVWRCDASSIGNLCAGLRSLSWNLCISDVDLEVLQEHLSEERSLFVLENISPQNCAKALAILPSNAFVVLTSECSLGLSSEISLSPLSEQTVATALSDVPAYSGLVESPLSLELTKGFFSVYGQSFFEDFAAGSSTDLSALVSFCVQKVLSERKECSYLLRALGAVCDTSCSESVYLPIFRLLAPSAEVEPARERLQRLRLVACDGSRLITVSRVVQAAVLANASAEDMEKTLNASAQVLTLLFSHESFSDFNAKVSTSLHSFTAVIRTKEFPTRAEFLLCLKYLMHLLNYPAASGESKELLEKVSSWFDSSPNSYDSNEFPTAFNIASCYVKLGDFAKAAEYYQEEVKSCEKVVSNDSGDLADACETLAGVYFRLRRWRKAEEVQLRVVKIREKTGTAEELVHAYSVMSEIYYEQQKLAEAEHFQQLAINLNKQRGIGDLPTLYNNLSSIYHAQQNHAAALSALNQAIRLDEENLHENPADLAVSYGNLGNLYRDMEEWEQAELWQRKAIEIKKDIYHESHPQLAISYHSLARTYFAQGKTSFAQSYESRALSIAEADPTFDPNHYAHFLHTMASIHKSKGQHTEALELARKSLTVRKEKAGEDRKELARVLRTVAALECATGQLAAAEATYAKAVELSEKSLPSNSEELRSCYREVLDALKGSSSDLVRQVAVKFENSNT